WGWVADLVNINAAVPGTQMCPSNPLRGTEKLNDILGKATNQVSDGGYPQRLQDGICGKQNFNGIAGPNAGSGFGGTAPNSPERGEIAARAFLNKGLNTNYAAGWHLV